MALRYGGPSNRSIIKTRIEPIQETVYRDIRYRLYADGSCSQWDSDQQIWLMTLAKVHVNTDPQFGDNGLLILKEPRDVLLDPEIMVCLERWIESELPSFETELDHDVAWYQKKMEFVDQVEPADWVAELGKWVAND